MMLLLALRVTYASEPTSIIRILNAVQELKILTSVLDCKDYLFALDLAALASRREFLNLELWLSSKLQADADALVPVLSTFLLVRTEPTLCTSLSVHLSLYKLS